MEIFINGTGIISPQPNFDETSFSLDSMIASNSNRLKCYEPDYKNFINPALLRRMSRMIKMGIASAKICLENSAVEKPGAILTATGLGCIEDTEKFIHSIIENDEKLLTPTPFIQSTHNTVGGQIALLLNCHEYNSTYVHRGSSFEFALLDASMLIQEGSADNILVGGIDELTDQSFQLLMQLGIYSRKSNVQPDLSDGTPGGEGSAFFLLSGKKNNRTIAKLSALKTYSGKITAGEISAKIEEVLQNAGKKIKDLDLVMLGNSGNKKTDTIYKDLEKDLFANSKIKAFKQFSGEYPTASAFALWYASMLLRNGKPDAPSSVLIYNNFEGSDHSIILVEKC
jgi:3-oxoacyl-[acyl-carrier-protein] synthase II